MKIHAVEANTAVTGHEVVASAESDHREIIQYGGQQFSCSSEMAQIFLKHAREVIESGEDQLVPLLHSGGIELLLVTRVTPYSLISIDER